jgi:hypothetical protein
VHESVVDRCGHMNINVRDSAENVEYELVHPSFVTQCDTLLPGGHWVDDSAENVEYELVHPSFVTQCDTLLPGGHWVDNSGVFARTSEKANRLVE